MLSFKINNLLISLLCLNSHRDEFDEEKEPDGMVLFGWTQSPVVEKDKSIPIGNGESTSKALQTVPMEADQVVDDIETFSTEAEVISDSKKRKAMSDAPSADNESRRNKLEELDDDDEGDDILILEDGNAQALRKKRAI